MGCYKFKCYINNQGVASRCKNCGSLVMERRVYVNKSDPTATIERCWVCTTDIKEMSKNVYYI